MLNVTKYITRFKVILLIAVCSAGLLTIWPLPESIALRYMLMVIGFILSLLYLSQKVPAILKPTAWPLWILLSFYGWICTHAIFFSSDYPAQLTELTSVWLRTFLVVPLGLALGLVAQEYEGPSNEELRNNHKKWLLIVIFLGLSGLTIISAGYYAYVTYLKLESRYINHLFSLYKAKQPFVIANALLLPLCFILISRALNTDKDKEWTIPAIISVLLSLFSSYVSDTKNGIAIFLIAFIYFLLNELSSFKSLSKKRFFAIFILVILTCTAYIGIANHFKKNPQWFSIITDVRVGIDIDHHNSWKDPNAFPAPVSVLNQPVVLSTYLRSAWFFAGTRLLLENPLGYGLLNHSFGALASTKWPDFKIASAKFRGATHSGWLDFALGLGIPGLLLVLIPLWASWYRSLYRKGLWFSYASWTIPLLSLAFLTTETAVSHFIEMLFFMTAFFCGLTLQKSAKT